MLRFLRWLDQVTVGLLCQAGVSACGSSTALVAIISPPLQADSFPVSSLTPALHYHPAPEQQLYAITSSDNKDDPVPFPTGLFIGCPTPVYIVLISQCVKGMGCNSFPESGDTLTVVAQKLTKLLTYPLPEEHFEGQNPY